MGKKIQLNILDVHRQEVFNRLYKVLGDDYYLAGGTALALQIGHRESFDFDLFRSKAITFTLKNKIIKAFADSQPQMLVDTADELTLTVDNIKITLLNYYWAPLFALVKVKGVIPLLSIRDIATTKAYALGRRGNYRDYFDLYVIIKDGYATLKEIVNWSEKKYGGVFSQRMLLEQLVFIGDLEIDTKLKYLGERYVSPKKMAEYFTAKISELK